MEMDHVFVCVKDPERAAGILKSLGMTEGTPNVHPGQGTANRRFFVRNAFIELLYLVDETQARSDCTAPTQLFERLSDSEGAASPFGICFRPSSAGEGPAFPTWDYRPAYLPAGLKVDVAGAPVAEPMWFFLSFAGRPDRAPTERAQPIEHPNGFSEITFVRVATPEPPDFLTQAGCANPLGGVEFVQGDEHLLALEFDGGRAGQSRDFRPELPLVIHW